MRVSSSEKNQGKLLSKFSSLCTPLHIANPGEQWGCRAQHIFYLLVLIYWGNFVFLLPDESRDRSRTRKTIKNARTQNRTPLHVKNPCRVVMMQIARWILSSSACLMRKIFVYYQVNSEIVQNSERQLETKELKSQLEIWILFVENNHQSWNMWLERSSEQRGHIWSLLRA